MSSMFGGMRLCFGGFFGALIAVVLLLQLGGGMREAAAAPAETRALGVLALQPPPQSFEERLGTWTRGLLRDVRRTFRRVNWLMNRSFTVWWKWFKRSARFILIAVAAALADGQLVAAWRREGLRVLVNYVPLMLYVYARLLLSPQVRITGKLLLILALAYGVRRSDLIFDGRSGGMLDDIVLIVGATRLFLYTCPEELVSSYAESAVNWRGRVAMLQRVRQR